MTKSTATWLTADLIAVCLALHPSQPQTAHPQTAHSPFTDRLMHIAQSWQYTAVLAEIPIPIRLAIPV